MHPVSIKFVVTSYGGSSIKMQARYDETLSREKGDVFGGLAPTGHLEFQVNDPELAKKFLPGMPFYMELTAADEDDDSAIPAVVEAAKDNEMTTEQDKKDADKAAAEFAKLRQEEIQIETKRIADEAERASHERAEIARAEAQKRSEARLLLDDAEAAERKRRAQVEEDAKNAAIESAANERAQLRMAESRLQKAAADGDLEAQKALPVKTEAAPAPAKKTTAPVKKMIPKGRGR